MSNVPNSLFNLRAGSEVFLGGVRLLKVVAVGQPFLKASLDLQDLKGSGVFLFNPNEDDWTDVTDTNPLVVGTGDKLIVGDVQIMMTAFSKSHGTIRLSMRSDSPETSTLIREARGHEQKTPPTVNYRKNQRHRA